MPDHTNATDAGAVRADPTAGPTATSVDSAAAHDSDPAPPSTPKPLRIQEAAAELGLTTRAIRYYEEMGLLEPSARSDGDYRLYDADDVDRLRYIKGLRDDAGFSLAEIAQLLEDETARTRNRARLRETHDPNERRAIIEDALTRVDRQIATLRAKAGRLESMIAEANARHDRLTTHLAEIDAEGPRAAEAPAEVPLDAETPTEPRR